LTPNQRVSTIGRWWPVLAWTAVIFGASSVPGSNFEDVGFDFPDKAAHAIEYAVLGFIAYRRARVKGGASAGRAFGVALLIGIGVGFLDENYQRMIPLRETSAYDWLADGLGTAAGAGLAAGFGKAGRRTR
jgi:VanZ family protein